jgi:hypothetical protein
MKIAAVVMMILATTAYSQNSTSKNEGTYFPSASKYQCMNLQKASAQYLAALSSENAGVVESALAHVAMMKVMLPTCNFEQLELKVNEMAVTAGSMETRYKAFLVKSVFDEPKMFNRIAYARYESADQWLGAIASRIGRAVATR